MRVVALLIAHRARADQTDMYHWSPLFAATSRNHKVIVENLLVALSAQGNVDEPDVCGGRVVPSDTCLAHGSPTYPVPHIDDPTHDGRTPLLEACIRGFTDIATLLIRRIADVNVTHAHLTPLLYAAKEGHIDIVNLLVTSQAELDHEDQDGHSAFQDAMNNGMWGVAAVLRRAGARQN